MCLWIATGVRTGCNGRVQSLGGMVLADTDGAFTWVGPIDDLVQRVSIVPAEHRVSPVDAERCCYLLNVLQMRHKR